jgi:hypothetical protein
MAENVSSQNICDFVKKGEGITFGTWVWYRKEILRPDSVLEFLTKNGVNEIYLAYAPEMGIENYRTFVARAAVLGVRVSLIGAEAQWVLERGHESRDAYFSFYENYQKTAAEEEKFYGMHMDIEPHQLEEWTNDNESTVKGYCDFVLLAREIADRTHTLLELDIPCWYDKFQAQDGTEATTLCDFCIHHADTTLFMSYRDSGRGAVEFADYGIKAGKKYGKKISLAFETGKIYEEVNITFDHMGTIPLNDELHKLREIMEQEFPEVKTGYAVHHYNSWLVLPPHGNPKGEDFPYDNPNYAHLLK